MQSLDIKLVIIISEILFVLSEVYTLDNTTLLTGNAKSVEGSISGFWDKDILCMSLMGMLRSEGQYIGYCTGYDYYV